MTKDMYRVQDISNNKIYFWTLEQVLHEINRDHSEHYTPYDESDWQEGWFEWCEGDCYHLLGKKFNHMREQYLRGHPISQKKYVMNGETV